MKLSSSVLAKTPTLISIILGLVLLLLQYFFGTFLQQIQIVVFVFFFAITGIPHGALDHLIQKQNDLKNNRKYSITAFLVKYLVIMGVYCLAWQLFPVFSFILFLVISAWHFGETDLENAPQKFTLWTVLRLFYGFYILAFMLLTHTSQASPVVNQMLENQHFGINLWSYLQINYKQVLYLLGLFLVTISFVAQAQNPIVIDKIRALRLLVILIISIYLPLTLAFALYFGGWHALCAFDSIHGYLKVSDPNISFKVLYMKALPFTFLAIFFLFLFYLFNTHFTSRFDPLAVLFVFISIITLPHLLIFNEMHNNNV